MHDLLKKNRKEIKHFLKIIQSFLRFVLKRLNSSCYKEIIRLNAEISVKNGWNEIQFSFGSLDNMEEKPQTAAGMFLMELPVNEHRLQIYKFLPLVLPPLYFYYKGMISIMADNPTPVLHSYPVIHCPKLSHAEVMLWKSRQGQIYLGICPEMNIS